MTCPHTKFNMEALTGCPWCALEAERLAHETTRRQFRPFPTKAEAVEFVDIQSKATRWTRDRTFIEIATIISRRSTCLRLQCGAIIEIGGRIISTGYNGAPSGVAHCTPDICGTDKPCDRTIHAEMNAVAFAARSGLAVDGGHLYCTDSPCLACAKIIINAGIKRVFYARRYRDPAPLDYLLAAGINSVHYAAQD